MNKLLISTASAIGIAAQSVSLASAGETGWISADEWIVISKTLKKNGEMPVAIKCKDTKNRDLNWDSGVINVQIERTPMIFSGI